MYENVHYLCGAYYEICITFRIILDFGGMKQMNRAEAQPHVPESETSYFHLFYEALHLFVYYRKI